MSGAGRTSALKSLEDFGFEAVDNVPLALLGRLVPQDVAGAPRSLAIGIDIRSRDFGAAAFLGEIGRLRHGAAGDVSVLFLDCDDEELARRYAETRHRHPLAQDRPLADGIKHERRLLASLRDRADLVIDTTGLRPADLERILRGRFAADRDSGLVIFLTSFGFAQGLPHEADLVFDVRFMRNPHYVAELRPLTGRDKQVADYVVADEGFAPFFEGLTRLLEGLLPRYAAEGRTCLTIALGCTGGRHRSVVAAERLADWLRRQGYPVDLRHRDS